MTKRKEERMKYWTLHRWVRKSKPKPSLCSDCNTHPPVDVANISGEYREDLNDFEWLCRKCHMKKDGRSIKLASVASHKGSGHSLSRITEKQVFEIKELRKTGLTYSHLAQNYGLSISHIGRICNGIAWKHLNGKRKPE